MRRRISTPACMIKTSRPLSAGSRLTYSGGSILYSFSTHLFSFYWLPDNVKLGECFNFLTTNVTSNVTTIQRDNY